jgi:hypothetical protein
MECSLAVRCLHNRYSCRQSSESPNDQVHRRGATALDDQRAYVCAASGATASSAARRATMPVSAARVSGQTAESPLNVVGSISSVA